MRNKITSFHVACLIVLLFGCFFVALDWHDTKELAQLKKEYLAQESALELIDERVQELQSKAPTDELQIELQRDVILNWQEHLKTRELLKKRMDELGTFEIQTYAYLVPLFIAVFAFFGIRKHINAYAEKEFSTLVGVRKAEALRVLKSEIWSVDIREKAKIAVVTRNKVNESVERILDIEFNDGRKQFNWKSIQLTSENLLLRELKSQSLDGVTCLLLDHSLQGDENLEWRNDEIGEQLKMIGDWWVNEQGGSLFYFMNDKTLAHFPRLKKGNHLTSFANSESQIYPNLMNLLKLQTLLKN